MFRNLILVLSLPAGTAAAQMAGHHGHRVAAVGDPDAAPRMEINDRMHQGMMIGFSGDADVMSVRGMIPHHQGAVEMAEYVPEPDHDPEVRARVEAITAVQETEISMMREWRAARGLE